ncbi:hypothetical protein ACFPO9_06570 [Massilia aerilata]|uniref:Uncharacterized protein n=1 Tax=Massilia aerilata TaxID=453817 RepID=A0ABW0RTM3_9BURK
MEIEVAVTVIDRMRLAIGFVDRALLKSEQAPVIANKIKEHFPELPVMLVSDDEPWEAWALFQTRGVLESFKPETLDLQLVDLDNPPLPF